MIQKLLVFFGPWRTDGSVGSAALLARSKGRALPGVDTPGRSALLMQEFRKRLQLSPAATPVATAATASSRVSRTARSTAPRVPRSTGQWMVVAGLCVSMCLVVWIMFSAWALVSTTHALAAQRLLPPSLKQFPALQSTQLFTPQAFDQDALRSLAQVEDSVVRVFQNIAAFENARSEEALRSARVQLQSVQAGSPAALAGVLAGDRIVKVNARSAEFVWDLYKAITEAPQQSFELTVQRGEGSFRMLLELMDDASFDMTNHGMVFGVPDHVRYLGQTDLSRLSKQIRSTYVNTQPTEWRRAYVDGLLSVSQELVANLSALAAITPEGKRYVRSEDLLGWYHTQFLVVAESYGTTLVRLQAHQSQALYQLGLGWLACGFACLVALVVRIKTLWTVS